MTNPSGETPFLIMRQGPQPNQTFPLDKAVITIGRSSENDIVIDDAEVSRHHARLSRSRGKWILEDLGSRNGTFVDGQRITTPTVLTSRSQIALGPDVVLAAGRGRPRRAARRGKRLPTLPILGGVAGIVVVGILFLGGLAALGYYLLSPSAGGLFSGTGSESDFMLASGPGVVIQQPASGVQVARGDSFLLSAIAMDEAGVTRIDLWVDDQIMLTQTSPDEGGITPFSLNYPMVATQEGSYAMVARAYNSHGLMGESPIHYVNVIDMGDLSQEQDLGQVVAQDGESLDDVAKRAGANPADVKKANPGLPSGPLPPGQAVQVPAKRAAKPNVVVPPPAPPPGNIPAPPPQPKNQPAVSFKNTTAWPPAVYYGKDCTTEPTVASVVTTIDPANMVKSVR
jgi:hypothetical protein